MPEKEDTKRYVWIKSSEMQDKMKIWLINDDCHRFSCPHSFISCIEVHHFASKTKALY